MPKYASLPEHLKTQLLTVEPSEEPYFQVKYYPCIVTLSDGRTLDFVYVVEAESWHRLWGVWPDEDRGKREIKIQDIVRIAESPSRLPRACANQLYEAGESGMGYTIFTVNFRDGTQQAFGTGNAIDFVDYPPDQSKETVVGVIPHVVRNDAARRSAPDYCWCLVDTI